MKLSPLLERKKSPAMEKKNAPSINQVSIRVFRLWRYSQARINIQLPGTAALKKKPKPVTAKKASTIGTSSRKNGFLIDIRAYI